MNKNNIKRDWTIWFNEEETEVVFCDDGRWKFTKKEIYELWGPRAVWLSEASSSLINKILQHCDTLQEGIWPASKE